jgi:hypothetical protein
MQKPITAHVDVAGILAVVVCAPAVYVTFDRRLEGVTRAASAGVMYTADTRARRVLCSRRVQIWEITNDQRIPAHAWDLVRVAVWPFQCVLLGAWFLIAVPLAIAVVAVIAALLALRPTPQVVLHHD